MVKFRVKKVKWPIIWNKGRMMHGLLLLYVLRCIKIRGFHSCQATQTCANDANFVSATPIYLDPIRKMKILSRDNQLFNHPKDMYILFSRLAEITCSADDCKMVLEKETSYSVSFMSVVTWSNKSFLPFVNCFNMNGSESQLTGRYIYCHVTLNSQKTMFIWFEAKQRTRKCWNLWALTISLW